LAAAAAYTEPPHAPEEGPAAEAGGEDISMEDVLGGGTKKAPAAAQDAADEVPQVESQTY
jgi:hypothetical protein